MTHKLKLVCFDLNGTLIRENTWLNLNLAMGMTKEEDEQLYQLQQKKIVPYVEIQAKLAKIYLQSGRASKHNILQAIYDYTYLPHAREIVTYLQHKGYILALITGNITLLAEKIAKELGIKHYAANNEMIFTHKGYLQELITLGDDAQVKLTQLQQLCFKLEIDLQECACVGDGANDALLFNATKHGITFKDSSIAKLAWKTIDNLLDLEQLL